MRRAVRRFRMLYRRSRFELTAQVPYDGGCRPEAAVRGERCNLWKLALSWVFRETAFESEF